MNRRIGNPFRVMFAQVRGWFANGLLRANEPIAAEKQRSEVDELFWSSDRARLVVEDPDRYFELVEALAREQRPGRSQPADLFSYCAGLLVGAGCALLWVGLVFWL
ncbi:hypothetical protein [Flexivirga alba]|uniref:Uncharacterized protein n=1 Tax=Flexivirga alba TaxID=702742 RepID=A0ABW2ALV1_9MICO